MDLTQPACHPIQKTFCNYAVEAAIWNNTEALEYLANQGILLGQASDERGTPLSKAVEHHNYPTVRLLSNQQVPLADNLHNAIGLYGAGSSDSVFTPATRQEYKKIIKLLIKAYPQHLNEPLYCASHFFPNKIDLHCYGSVYLVPEFYPPNAYLGTGEYTPLHIAAFYGTLDIAKKLLKHKAQVNIQDHRGRTPLYLAVAQQKWEMAKLLSGQTDLSLTDITGKNVHTLAQETRNEQMMRMLEVRNDRRHKKAMPPKKSDLDALD